MEPWYGAPVLCELKRAKTPIVSRVPLGKGTALVQKCFDYQFTGESRVYPFVIPPEILNLDVNIIQIVGPSGAGKSTFLKAFANAGRGWHFPTKKYNSKVSLIDNFSDPQEGLKAFSAVGLGDKPLLVKPRNVLSTGEGFRADMALNLESNVMIDEYTSVINREVAMSASNGVQRYIRKRGFKNVILCGCHKDIVPTLKPDILIDLEVGKVFDLRNYRLGKALTSPSSKSTGRRSERSGKFSLRITI